MKSYEELLADLYEQQAAQGMTPTLPKQEGPKTTVQGDKVVEIQRTQNRRKGKGVRNLRPPEDRFKAKWRLQKKTGCHKWLGTFNKWGKSTFFDGKDRVNPSEYAWFLATGAKPIGKLVRTCDTVECINPAHHKEFSKKIKRKQSVFTVEDVLEIRRCYDAGESVISIAKRYKDASEQSVGQAARRTTYRWITEK